MADSFDAQARALWKRLTGIPGGHPEIVTALRAAYAAGEARGLERAGAEAKASQYDCFCKEKDERGAACMEAARIEGRIRGLAR